ncbi:MAG: hypothetical protein NVS9B15_06670 [Acidobacteriaceae bacterium]
MPEILPIDRANPDPALIAYCAYRIKRGDVVVIPTDTYYGLAVDPVNVRAVQRVYEIKSRVVTKPLTLAVSSMEQAAVLARDVPDIFFQLAHKFWPGPLTMIVKAGHRLPLRVTANTGNVAVRVPASLVAQALVEAMGFPVTATASSMIGFPECSSVPEVCGQLGERVSLVMDGGDVEHRNFTTIVDLSGTPDQWNIQRAGAIPAGEVAEVLWA